MKALRMILSGILVLNALYGAFLLLGDVTEIVSDAPRVRDAGLFAAGSIGQLALHLATTLLMAYWARLCWPKSAPSSS